MSASVRLTLGAMPRAIVSNTAPAHGEKTISERSGNSRLMRGLLRCRVGRLSCRRRAWFSFVAHGVCKTDALRHAWRSPSASHHHYQNEHHEADRHYAEVAVRIARDRKSTRL